MKKQFIQIELDEYKDLLKVCIELERITGQYQVLYNEYVKLLPNEKVLEKKNPIGFRTEE